MRDPLPDRTDNTFLQQLLTSLNTLRARHGSPALTLDLALVDIAKGRAAVVSTYDGLDEGHRGAVSGYGENLSWQGSLGDDPAPTTGASDGWYGEIVNYNFAPGAVNDFSSTGHFTQLVWKASTKFGAARAFGKGPDFNETYIVGIFAEAGNVGGQYDANVVTPAQGKDDGGTVRWTAFDGTSWTPVALLSGHQTAATPGMAVLAQTPYALFRGNDNKLWYSAWATATTISGCLTDFGVGAATYRDKVYLLFRNTGTNALFATSFDGMAWSAPTTIQSSLSAGPAAAVYQDKLYCAHRSGTDAGMHGGTCRRRATPDAVLRARGEHGDIAHMLAATEAGGCRIGHDALGDVAPRGLRRGRVRDRSVGLPRGARRRRSTSRSSARGRVGRSG